MKNILICYKSNTISNNIASSTMARFAKFTPEDLNVQRVNLDKRSLFNYIKRNDNLANSVIYVHGREIAIHKHDFDRIKEMFPNVKIMLFTNAVRYRPERVKGNNLKTVVYYLYDKIIYENEYNFLKIKAYKVDFKNMTIKEVMTSPYDIQVNIAKKLTQNYDTYISKEEAKTILIKSYQDKIRFINLQLDNVKKKQAELARQTETLLSIKVNLLSQLNKLE